MLKKLALSSGLLLAALGTCASAQAQSSVTLFGVTDAAVRHVSSDAGSRTSLASGANSSSRFGFRGREDLGNGLAAGFHLESGIKTDDGTGGSNGMFFDRRSTLSLFSKTLGEIRLGRDLVPTHANWSRFDPFGYVGLAKGSNLISGAAANPGPVRAAFGATADGLNTVTRSSNAIQLLLPSGLGGLEGGVMYAFQEGGVATDGRHKLLGLRLGYASGPFVISAATAKTQNSITGGESFKDSVIAGSYDFDFVQLTAGLRRLSYLTSTQNTLMVGLEAPIGSGVLKFSYGRTNLSGRVGATNVDANDATQIAFGYQHNLSKRTALYATYARMSNDGNAAFNLPDGPATVPGRSMKGYEAGIRHSF